MDLRVTAAGWLYYDEHRIRCALGRGGVRRNKREGDGATPVGRFPLRRVLYRGDRLQAPVTALPVARIARDDGWCDDPTDQRYNRPVSIPYTASHELLWRANRIYDIIVVLGHNDAPVVAGAGSAIFLHIARPDYAPTDGCLAVARRELIDLLRLCDSGSTLIVAEETDGGAD
ncbi:MAG: L,D-transpeptidase family protein [Alphaproteobacteria bacterium]|nr:L,D-transpeptidase family protein [Alphaproteobacteria bacterium]